MSYLGAQNSIALGVQGLIHIDTGGGAGGSADYLLAKSLRFRSSASAYLNRTPAVAGNQSTWTWSGWIKRGLIGSSYQFFGAGAGTVGSPECFVQFDGDQLLFQVYNGNTTLANVKSTAFYRDPAAWYHIVIAVDVTQATASDRVLFYVNGQKVTAFAAASYPGSGALQVNATTAHQISGSTRIVGYFFDGDIAEVNFVDGYPTGITQSLWASTNIASSFGASSTYNQWLPKKYTGTYGTNGFYLPFTNTASTTTLVADSSGNANNWTPNSISLTAGSTYDSLTDVPTLTSETVANYAVLNVVNPKGTSTVSNGNLTESITGQGAGGRGSTIAVTSGKFYVEAIAVGGGAMITGVGVTSPSASTYNLFDFGVCYYSFSGHKIISSVDSAYGTAWATAGTYTIGMALDVGAGTLQFYLNNVAQGSITLPTMPSDGWIFMATWGSTAGSVTYNWNYGQQPFTYSAPTGFLPLNTYNI